MTPGKEAVSHRLRPSRAVITLLLVTMVTLATAVAVINKPTSSESSVIRTVASVEVTPSGTPLKVLFVGDSITHGAYAMTVAQSYRATVIRALAQRTEVQATFVGGSGQTSVNIQPKITSQRYDLVVVAVGTNDLTKLPADQFRTNYRRLLDSIRAASPQAGLVCAGVWLNPNYVKQADPVIDTTCRERHGVFVGLGDLYINEKLRGPQGRWTEYGRADNFHPNEYGHAAIAQRVLNSIHVVGS